MAKTRQIKPRNSQKIRMAKVKPDHPKRQAASATKTKSSEKTIKNVKKWEEETLKMTKKIVRGTKPMVDPSHKKAGYQKTNRQKGHHEWATLLKPTKCRHKTQLGIIKAIICFEYSAESNRLNRVGNTVRRKHQEMEWYSNKDLGRKWPSNIK